MSSGVYLFRVGPVFYIGSSTNFARRKSNHVAPLKWGEHSNPRIQKAYDEHGGGEFIPLEFIHRNEGEDLAAFKTRLRHAEQRFLDRFKGDPNLANLSTNAFGPDNGALMKRLWGIPAYREMMVSRMQGRVFTEETKKRMSLAKKGFQNPKARAVVVTAPTGAETVFPSTTDAAAFFGVTQQLFHLWLTGGVKWPGPNKGRKRNRWVADYRAKFAD